MNQLPLIPEQAKRLVKPTKQEYEALGRQRLSKNFILRDFLFSTDAAALGMSNFPEDPAMVIRSGRELCERLLEPILAHFGKFSITYGYACRDLIEYKWTAEQRVKQHFCSSPHNWDRMRFGEEVYARVDILPFCVADGLIDRYDFARWCMLNLDIDLLQQFTRSNGYCISISPKPRRIWLEWGVGPGVPRCKFFMGTHYWNNIYPNLPVDERPKFAPSCTGGRMFWWRK